MDQFQYHLTPENLSLEAVPRRPPDLDVLERDVRSTVIRSVAIGILVLDHDQDAGVETGADQQPGSSGGPP